MDFQDSFSQNAWFKKAWSGRLRELSIPARNLQRLAKCYINMRPLYQPLVMHTEAAPGLYARKIWTLSDSVHPRPQLSIEIWKPTSLIHICEDEAGELEP
jgi:hypothetical protein